MNMSQQYTPKPQRFNANQREQWLRFREAKQSDNEWHDISLDDVAEFLLDSKDFGIAGMLSEVEQVVFVLDDFDINALATSQLVSLLKKHSEYDDIDIDDVFSRKEIAIHVGRILTNDPYFGDSEA